MDRALAEAALRRRGPHEASVNAEWLRREVDQEGRFGEWNVGVSKAIRWPDKRAIDQATATHITELAHVTAEDVRHQVAMDLLQTWMQWRVANELVQSALTREEASQREWQAIDARWRVGQSSAAA